MICSMPAALVCSGSRASVVIEPVFENTLLASIGAAGRKVYSYQHTMNGFAADGLPGTARAIGIAAVGGVLLVAVLVETGATNRETPATRIRD